MPIRISLKTILIAKNYLFNIILEDIIFEYLIDTYIISYQKSASTVNFFSSFEAITPDFWYSPTLLSKKLVFPCKDIISIHSNGFFVWYTFFTPKATSNLSATHSMYWVIN